jgi:lysophospholipase L1-like esterase
VPALRSHRRLSRTFAAASGVCLLVLAYPASSAPIRTLLVGDSITFGIVSEPSGPSYAESLTTDLAATHEVVNVGVSGTSAFYWAPGTPCPGICPNADNLFDEFATPELPADLATLLLGTNDAVGLFLNEPTPAAAYESFVRDIIDALFDGGVHTVVLMTAPHSNLADPAVDVRLDSYRNRVGTICGDTFGVICGPDLFALLDTASDFAANDVHPNALGHQKIATALAETIRAIPEPGTFLLVGMGLIALATRLPRERGHGEADRQERQ